MKIFDEIYEELQSQDNAELKALWQEAKKGKEKASRISKIICLMIDIFAVVIIATKVTNRFSLFAIFPLIIPILVINLFVVVITNILCSGREQNLYNQKYKDVVINKLMNNFYNNLEYFPLKPMPEYIYKDLEYEVYDIYESEDYIEAQIDNKYSIQMAEIHTKKEETYKDSDGNTKTRTITKFNGLFAKVIMKKSINSELAIMQNRNGLSGSKKLEMDSSEFEKYFDVNSSNAIIGMQILTADIMEELLEFRTKTNMDFDVVIKENELYIRFHSGDMFEASGFKNEMLDKDTIQQYFYMLNFTYNLSKRIINIVENTHI